MGWGWVGWTGDQQGERGGGALHLKGTVARDLQLWFFSSKESICGSNSYPTFFQIWFQIRRVTCIQIRSLTLRCIMQRGVKKRL